MYFFIPEMLFYQKNKKKHEVFRAMILYKMIPAGFEPATVRLEGECSIQLSYETNTISFYQKNLLSSRFTYGKDFPAES